jgi:UDP-glucuronate 4-epimerase
MPTLITGGCGFVGINLAEALLSKGEPVVLFDRRPLPDQARAALSAGHAPLTMVSGDARDTGALTRLIREHRVERVVHAAVITSGVQREASAPGDIIDVNIGGTVGVMEAARASGCRRVLYVSSGAAYGQTLDEAGPLDEDASPSRPDTLYGITKYAAERTVLRLRALWELDALCVRLGTVFGPWEYATGARDRLSPQLQLARLALRGEAAVLPAREVRRDWVYSRDVAAGLAALLDAARASPALFHLSSGRDWAGFFPRWCAQLQAAYPGFSWRVAAAAEQPNIEYNAAADRAPMDVSRIAAGAGFVPRFGPREAAGDFISWIGRHPDWLVPGPWSP